MIFEIILAAEIKDNGSWKLNEKPVFRNLFKEYGIFKQDYLPCPQIERNFILYAMLTGHQNNFNVQQIKTQYGIPKNASRGWKDLWEKKGYMLKLPGSFYLDSLLNFNWDRKFVEYGFISIDDYRLVRNSHLRPFHFYENIVSTDKQIIINQKDAEAIIATDFKYHKKMKGKNIYVDYHWVSEYNDYKNKLMETLIDPLQTLKHEFDDVRMVYGFKTL